MLQIASARDVLSVTLYGKKMRTHIVVLRSMLPLQYAVLNDIVLSNVPRYMHISTLITQSEVLASLSVSPLDNL